MKIQATRRSMKTAVETAQRRSIQRIRQSAGRQAPHAHQEALKYDPVSLHREWDNQECCLS